jgi:non-homologous end joining protein Ku
MLEKGKKNPKAEAEEKEVEKDDDVESFETEGNRYIFLSHLILPHYH